MIESQSYYNEDTKIWHGPIIEPSYGLNDSIGSVILEAMRKDPDHVIQISYPSGKEFTNREMAELSCRAATHYGKLKLEQTDVVGICAGNSDYVAPIFYGAIFSGLCLSTTDPSANVKGLRHTYSLTKPKIMFCDGDIYDKVQQALQECGLEDTVIYTVRNHIEGVPNVMEVLDEKYSDTDFRVPVLKHGGRQDAFFLCTSGSTSLPKAVRLSHYTVLNRIQSERTEDQKMLVFSSVYWLMGLLTLVQCAVNHTTRVISENPFTPKDFYDIVEKHRITLAASSPSHIPLCLACPETLAASDLSSIEVMVVTGKSLPYPLVAKFKEYAVNCFFPILYGMTELCGAVSSGEVNPRNSAGSIVANTNVKIMNDAGERLGPNETGEIYVQAKFISSGYYCNPEANSKTFLEDGWVRTGDMGYFNDDGELFIVDRRQDIMKYNNFHFSPTTIEKVICEIPDVAEVCVVGIPDLIYDNLPAAAVIRRNGANITESEISEYVASRMQHFENLHGGVYFFESLPLTASGKIIRKDVTEMCAKLKKLNER
ncbi:probable 4-coumarate--CoA ligase 1 [Musca domestica]|uniref:Probable 4-coumarate--CoA ligase 1 n=1 Tax=Musca domestica TaxID=7370 RepID=A0A9J7DC68_MUSDO|nr:probable 4-coumarate--CoA ligase 1 [Musca domestica]